MKPFVLVHAASLAEASRATVKPDAALKAGGVDLLDRMKEGLEAPATVVSIAKVPDLDRIEAGPPAKIGALATLSRISEDPGIAKSYPALAQAAAGAATPQIRNMATLGGNLCQRPRCWYYRLEEFDCRKKGGGLLRDQGEPVPRNLRHGLLCCCVTLRHGTASAYGRASGWFRGAGLPIEKFFFAPPGCDPREHLARRVVSRSPCAPAAPLVYP
jgi:xanthine dehydrogenase YagS FAD-binding subunit